MSTPSATAPTDDAAKPSPLVGRVYGEPCFHADGDLAAVAFAADGTVRSIDEAGVLRHWAADGRALARYYLSDLETLWAFSPDAALLASGNDDLILWDAAAGQLIRRFAQDSWVTAVAFSADGRTVASGHDDGTVRLWDVRSQKALGKFLAHPKAVSAISFSPTGDYLATAGEDRLVRVWDNFSHKLVGDLRSHTDRVPALVWSPDGKLLVSAGWDTSARVWQVGKPDPLMLLNSHADQVTTLAWSPDGKFLACADSDFDITLWSDAATGKSAHVLRGHADDVRCLAFNADGTRLASAGLDRVVHIWDTQTGKLVAGPNPTGRHAVAVVPGPTPKLASTAGPTVRVWDATTGAEVAPTGLCTAASVAASADGKWIAVGGANHFTHLCDTATGAVARKLEATKPPVGAVAFSPDSSRVAHTSPADGLVWVWKTDGDSDAELILIEAADGCTLEGLAFHPDGNHLACGGIDYLSTGLRDGAVCLWNLTTKERAFTLDVGVRSLAFDPAGKYLAAAGVTDTVFVWDVDTQETVFELAGHQDTTNAVVFDPSGSYLVSGGDDMTVRVWDVLSGRLLVSREFDSPVQALAFSADGAHLYLGNGNTTCYQVEFKKLLED